MGPRKGSKTVRPWSWGRMDVELVRMCGGRARTAVLSGSVSGFGSGARRCCSLRTSGSLERAHSQGGSVSLGECGDPPVVRGPEGSPQPGDPWETGFVSASGSGGPLVLGLGEKQLSPRATGPLLHRASGSSPSSAGCCVAWLPKDTGHLFFMKTRLEASVPACVSDRALQTEFE